MIVQCPPKLSISQSLISSSMTSTANLRQRWEARAQIHQNDKRGVLYQGLPASINQAIHRWHGGIVAAHFANRLPSNASVVDLAAGYGRLSRVVQQNRPDVQLHGVDLSLTYSQLYQQQIAPALCADMTSLPFAESTWDGVLLVTGLMYLEETSCPAVIGQILRTLKPGGVLLCIDPGREITEGLRRLRPRFGQQTTGGDGFTREGYLQLFKQADCSILASGSNGYFTLALPLLLAMNRLSPMLTDVLAEHLVKFDLEREWFARYALHRWVVVQRVDRDPSG